MKTGFYKELDEIREDDPEANFGFLQVVCNMRRFSAFDFLHGYCLDFALVLSDEMGYKIETLRNPDGDLIHAYCIAEEECQKLYVDVRGVTNNPTLFFEEFKDELGVWFECPNDFIEVFENSEAYLNACPVDELFLDAAWRVMEENWHFYDVTIDEVVRGLREEKTRLDDVIRDAGGKAAEKNLVSAVRDGHEAVRES